MDNIKKKGIMEYSLKSVKFIIKKNKINNQQFDVFFFDVKNWNTIHDLKIEKIPKQNIHHFKEYISQLKIKGKSIKDLSFNNYMKSLNKTNNTHFIWSLIDQCQEVENRLIPILSVNEDKINKYYKDIIKISELDLDSSLNLFKIESISDDIYWTTTMEAEIVDKDFISKILSDKNSEWKNLSELEATNIRNWFLWSINNSNNLPLLTPELLKGVHTINTKNLDKYVEKWLKYYSWKFRNEIVNMWIFNSVNGDIDYLPPLDPTKYIDKLCNYFNKWEFNIIKLANLHLILYSLHPFYNGNKRTTRIIESLYIQWNYDKWHYFKWMWYWFKKNINSYIKQVRDVLSWKKTLKQWNIYYINSFLDMCKYSLHEIQNLKNDITLFVKPSRVKYYNDKDKIFYRFYLNSKDKLFSIKELFLYLNKNWIKYSDMNKLNKRITKHLKDEIIIKTNEKNGKMFLYRFNIEKTY